MRDSSARFLRRKLPQTVVLLWGVATLVFVMLYVLPGDPVSFMLRESAASPELVARLREQLGLNRPVHVQYLAYLAALARGDFGTSLYYDRPVMELVLEQVPATIQLAVAAMSLALPVGVGAGALAAARRNTRIDRAVVLVTTLGVAMPTFWLSLLFIFLFSLTLGWLPATGTSGVERLVMPALVLMLGSASAIARLVRSSLLEELRRDYIRTAAAKGLPAQSILFGHALRNAMLPIVTVAAMHFGQLLSGTVVTETIFARQGLGRLAVQAVLGKDLPVVAGTVLLAAFVYVAVSLTVDFAYGLLDPRSRSAAR